MTFFKAGFSFEAGGRAYRPFVSQSTSGTFYFYCPFSFNILLFKNNLSELQPCLRNAGNGISECFFYFKNFLGGMPPETPRCPLRCLKSALSRQDKFSRPVLSQPCPLLYKAIENPVKVRKQSKCWNNHLLFYIICSCWLCENIEFLERTEFNVSCAKGWFNWPLIHKTKWEVEPLLSLVKTLSTRGRDGRNLGSSQVLAFAWCDLSYYL